MGTTVNASPLALLLELLSLDLPQLEQIARETKAYQFSRGFVDFSAYLQFLLLWALEDVSLRNASLWLQSTGLGKVSPPSLQERIDTVGGFFKELVNREFSRRKIEPPKTSFRLLLVDATSVCFKNTDTPQFYLHTLYDPVSASLQNIHLSPVTEGESFRHQTFQPGDVVVGDRGYASANAVREIKQAQADVVVRIRYQEGALWYTPSPEKGAHKFEPLSYFDSCNLAEGEYREVQVHWKAGRELQAGRVIGYRLTEAQAEKSRDRLRRTCEKKGRKPNENQKQSTQWVFLFTTLPAQHTAQEILDLYRYRWQIELLFKRLKSLLHLDQIRTRKKESNEAFLWGKILVALLLERLEQTLEIPAFFFSPPQPERRKVVSVWRVWKLLLCLLQASLWSSLLQSDSLQQIRNCQRGLSESFRKRKYSMDPLFPVEWGSA